MPSQSALGPPLSMGRSLLAWAVASAFIGLTSYSHANPSGGVAVIGKATFDASQASKLVVTTQNGAGTNYSAINWQSFSIPAGSTTRIQQPSATSLSINRVVTNTPSLIFGTLSSNGQVVLVNQAGIAVGTGALVDTAGFTASVLGMQDADALAGRLRFTNEGFAGATGVLTVQGNIIARGGDVVLIAPSIELAQSAVVEAPGGSVILAAGRSVEVTGRGLEGISMQVQAPADQVLNLGTLRGDAVGIFAGTLRHSGLIQATTASLEGGRVLLKASADAYVEGAGRIEATGFKGGQVDVFGQRVAVMNQAVIDVSGQLGGGNIRVGGDYQGRNTTVQNAQGAYFGAEAKLKANALDVGNGGRIILWADDATRAYGQIEARGGPNGGDGGFVETSGKQRLDFSARVDTSAPKGRAGTVLLDPDFIVISNGVSGADDGQVSDNNVFATDGVGLTYTISEQAIEALSSGAILLQANKGITLNNLSDNLLQLNSGITSFKLETLNSGTGQGISFIDAADEILSSNAASIIFNAGASGSLFNIGKLSSSGSGGGAITLTAGNAMTLAGNISSAGTLGGPITLKSGAGGINATASVLQSDSLEIQSSGAVTMSGANIVNKLAANVAGNFTFNNSNSSGLQLATVGSTSGVQATGGGVTISSAGTSTLSIQGSVSATGNIDLTGYSVQAIGSGISSTGGNVTINGAQGIFLTGGSSVSGNNISLTAAPGVNLNGSTLKPGGIGGIGTLTINGNLTMLGGATLALDVLNASTYDTVNISGTLTASTAAEIISVGDLSSGVVSGTLSPVLTAGAIAGPALLFNGPTGWSMTQTTTALSVNAVMTNAMAGTYAALPGSTVAAFIESFEDVLFVAQQVEAKDKVQDALVVEGEICRP